MKIEEVEGLREILDGVSNKVQGAESLLQKHKSEFGEAKAKAENAEKVTSELKDLLEYKEKIKKVIDSYEAKADNSSSGKDSVNNQDRNQSGGTSTSVEDLSKKMTKEQKERADKAFKSLPPEDRIIIKADPEKRNEFFKAAIEAAPSVPESLFDTESANTEDDKFGFKKFFGLGNKEKNFVPGGRNVGATGFSGADSLGSRNESGSKRLIGGKIPRPTVTQTKE